ncbi:site-specific DNA-methyltransferase [Cryobacterium sp. Sr8]|uniref:site-specific DNA-methyltransferase n=1 Tax=Cryobacterium sp. Sr8 TaxID=1259203 RepID=UPI00141B648F|nr:DNA methyltransferase [Cryobacterium sp. Sr8]
MVVEGDNLPVLEALREDFRAAVDVIFLDGPYNGRSRRLTYRDSHADWADDLRIRLTLARELLSKLGVIVLAVDDAEIGRLRVLADSVFGSRQHLTTLVHQGDVSSGRRFTGGGVDYMVVYGRSKQAMMDADVRWRERKPGVTKVLSAGAKAWSNADGSAAEATILLRAWWKGRKAKFSPGLREYTRVDETGRVFRIGPLGVPQGRGSGRYDLFHPATGRPVTPPPGDWVAPPATMTAYIEQDRVLFGPDETTTPWRKLFLDEQLDQVPVPSFSQTRAEGTKLLNRIFDGEARFSHPKDPSILARWFKVMAGPDATFLDFYAGSGTTAEAVMMLNAEDGGTRRSILVTNNEVSVSDQKTLTAAGHEPGDAEWESRGVFRRVCRPRIETIVTGVREDGSEYTGQVYAENVDFFRVK